MLFTPYTYVQPHQAKPSLRSFEKENPPQKDLSGAVDIPVNHPSTISTPENLLTTQSTMNPPTRAAGFRCVCLRHDHNLLTQLLCLAEQPVEETPVTPGQHLANIAPAKPPLVLSATIDRELNRGMITMSNILSSHSTAFL